MKKILSIVLLSSAVCASAQLSFAAKANVLIPTSSATWENLKTAVSQNGKNIIGFNAGLSMKVNLPTAIFVMPEIYYTNFSNEFTVSNDMNNSETTPARIFIASTRYNQRNIAIVCFAPFSGGIFLKNGCGIRPVISRIRKFPQRVFYFCP